MPAFFNSFIGNVAIEVLDGTHLGVPFKIFNGVKVVNIHRCISLARVDVNVYYHCVSLRSSRLVKIKREDYSIRNANFAVVVQKGHLQPILLREL